MLIGKLNLASNLHATAALARTAHSFKMPTNSMLSCRSHGGCNLRGRYELIISQSKNEPTEVCPHACAECVFLHGHNAVLYVVEARVTCKERSSTFRRAVVFLLHRRAACRTLDLRARRIPAARRMQCVRSAASQLSDAPVTQIRNCSHSWSARYWHQRSHRRRKPLLRSALNGSM